MASRSAPFCSQCGAPLQSGQRFCSNCGATTGIDANSPTAAASQAPLAPPAGPPAPVSPSETTYPDAPPTASSLFNTSTHVDQSEPLIAPPPPPPIYNPYTSGLPEGQSYLQRPPSQSYGPAPAPPVGAYQVPEYARKPRRKRGCATTGIVLLLVLALGIGGYFLIHSLITRGTNNPNGSGSQGNTPTSGGKAASMEQLNLQVTYASVNITINSVQVANSFSDDPYTTAGSAGIVRINLRENNPTNNNPAYLEGDRMLLILPGGTTVQMNNAEESVSPAGGVNRQNWLDFQIDNQVTLSQLTLRIGAQGESQMDIPLQPNANVSKYQDQTSTIGAQFKYGGLDMTLKTATLSYSADDQQATAGNRYVIVTLAATNNTSEDVETVPSSIMRLQTGGTNIQPNVFSTFPFVVTANTSASGNAVFLVPQGTTTFTFVMLAESNASQVTQNFQIT